jgi:Tfp pilus assembly protein PilF
VNVFLHAANAVLVWRLLRKLKVTGAWLAAAIFAVHPVNVESVAWVTERKNVLSGFFYLTALLAYLRLDTATDAETPDARPDSWKFYWWALGLYAGALLSKSVTCSLPVAILLLTWWKRGRLRWRDVYLLLPFAALGIAMGVNTIRMENHLVDPVKAEYAFSWVQRCLIASRALCFYGAKLLWPRNLTFIYPRWSINPTEWWQWLFALAAVGAIAILWVRRNRWEAGPLVGTLFFAVTLGPALGFVNVYPFRYSFVADHFQYLASVGLIALAASGGTLVCERNGPGVARAGAVVAAALLLVLSALTWQQTELYRNAETLWRDTLSKNPACWLAHNNLGLLLEHRDQVAEAEEQYRLALQLFPDDVKAHVNLGNALARQGKPSEAAQQYEEPLRIQPDDVRARINLGNVWLLQGNLSGAIGDYQEALRIDPHSVEAHLNLGVALEQAGRVSEAIEQYEQALRLNPDLTAARNALMRLHSVETGR